MTPSRTTVAALGANLRWGVAIGVVGAFGFSLLALVLAMLRGSTSYPQYGMSTWSVIGSYFAVGLPAGAIIGALRPLLRWRAGAALVGYFAAVVVYGGVGLIMNGPTIETLGVGAILGLGGAAAGLWWWPHGPGGPSST